jgi:hypothetical protein
MIVTSPNQTILSEASSDNMDEFATSGSRLSVFIGKKEDLLIG